MERKIFIELFRFDVNTDYLPYYQKHTLAYSEVETINNLLEKINDNEKFGFEANGNLKVNELYINAREKVTDIVAQCGNEIQINPISEFRAQKDLIIDKSDFIEKLSLISDYIGAEKNISYRKSTELAYYASNTLNYNRDYIGDHVLIIAADLIEERFELRAEIIEKLISAENGLWYHTSLENRMLCSDEEKKIQKLIYLARQHIKPKTKFAKKLASLCERKQITDFENVSSSEAAKVSQSFEGFNIAVYHGVQSSGLEQLIDAANASCIDLSTKNDDLASYSILVDENFSSKIASDILIEAKDNNADFILVKNEATKEFFDKNQKRMEKLAGREIGLSVISKEQFIKLLEGEKDSSKLGFNKHKVGVTFLAS